MKREVLIQSSYDAAFLVTQGIDYKVVPRADGRDVDFVFPTGKQLEAARSAYNADLDLQEFIEAHRRLKWAAKKILQDRSTNESPRSRR